MTKVMQVLLSPRIGGAETLAAALQEEWKRMDINSCIAYVDPNNDSSTSRRKRIQHIRGEYARHKPDIVLSHSAIPNLYCRLALPRSSNVIAVLHNSGDDYSYRSLRYAELFLRKWRDCPIIAVSEVAQALYLQRFGSKSEVYIIENGVADPGFSKRLITEPEKILTLARVTTAKNPWLWNDTARHLLSRGSILRFDWVGPVDKDLRVSDLTQREDEKSHRTNFLGPTPNGSQILSKYDLYFHPADREALGISIVEAVLSGLPVICSDNVANVVGKHLIAETFITGDFESASNAIQRAVTHFRSHLDCAHNRREQALDQYGIAKCAKAYHAVFSRVLNLG